MFDKIDQHLDDWSRSVIGDIDVSFEAPNSETSGHKIGIYLFEIRQTGKRVGGNSQPPLRFELRYLITSWSQQPKEAHRALGQLLFSALESRQFEVEIAPLPATFWNSFKCAPRPCFVIQFSVYHELTVPAISTVKVPPQIQAVASTALFGKILGPNRIPLVGTSVELPNLALMTSSNVNGDFRFASVPANPIPSEIIVMARGREYRHQVESNTDVTKPIIIEIP